MLSFYLRTAVAILSILIKLYCSHFNCNIVHVKCPGNKVMLKVSCCLLYVYPY